MTVPHPYDELPFRRDELIVGVYLDIAFERRWQARDLCAADPDAARLLSTIADAYEMRAKALQSEIIAAKHAFAPVIEGTAQADAESDPGPRAVRSA